VRSITVAQSDVARAYYPQIIKQRALTGISTLI